MTEGWKYRKLSEIGKVQTGTTPSTKNNDNYGNYISFVKPAHFSPNGEIDSGDSLLSKEGLKNGRLIDANSVLMVCIGATIGKTGFTSKPVSTNQQINALTPKKDVDHKYIYYGMISSSFQNKILEEGKSSQATLPIINKTKWENLELPIPPLSEQRQIVAILDKAFAAIDQAKANIEKNIENAKELFQSKLNEVFSQKGDGWEKKRLGEVSFVKSGGTPLRSKTEYWENGVIPWYSSGELNDLLTLEPERHITETGLSNSNARLFPKGSLLIGMYDTAALKMSIIDRDATFNQAIAGVEPQNDINLIYILHAINSIKPKLLQERRGVRQKNLSLTKIKEIKIPIPDENIQNEVVKHLDSFNKRLNQIDNKYHQKLNELEELKKSILQKAFSGELVKENNYANA